MVTVYEADNRFFVQSGLTVCEIPYVIVQAWDHEGIQINLIHMEGRD